MSVNHTWCMILLSRPLGQQQEHPPGSVLPSGSCCFQVKYQDWVIHTGLPRANAWGFGPPAPFLTSILGFPTAQHPLRAASTLGSIWLLLLSERALHWAGSQRPECYSAHGERSSIAAQESGWWTEKKSHKELSCTGLTAQRTRNLPDQCTSKRKLFKIQPWAFIEYDSGFCAMPISI